LEEGTRKFRCNYAGLELSEHRKFNDYLHLYLVGRRKEVGLELIEEEVVPLVSQERELFGHFCSVQYLFLSLSRHIIIQLSVFVYLCRFSLKI
jgi:hypothetical protein